MTSATFGAYEVDFINFNQVSNDGKLNGDCELSGLLGKVNMDLFVTQWKRLGNNCTIEKYDSLGTLVNETTNSYSGVKGGIMNRIIDVTFTGTTIYELPIGSVEYSLPIHEEFLTWFWAYSYTEKGTPMDIIDLYLQFNWSFYVSLILSLIGFLISFHIFFWSASKEPNRKRRKELINRRHKPNYWIVLTTFLNQPQFPNIPHVIFPALCTLLCLFNFFYVNVFMMSIMSTDLVVMEEPDVVTSYKNAIKREGLKIFFISGLGEDNFFRHAKEGTDEWKIWQKRKEETGKINSEVAAANFDDWLNQRTVLICRDWFGHMGANIGIGLYHSDNPNIRFITAKDETGKKFTQGYMISSSAPKAFKEYFAKRVYGTMESGIITWFLRGRFPRIAGESEISIDIFVSEKLFLGQMPLPHVGLSNILKVAEVFSALIIFAVIVLLFEKIFYVISSNL